MSQPRWPVCVLPVRSAVLAPVVGAAGATALGRALVEDAVGVIRTLPWARPVRASDDDVGRVLPQAVREHDGGAAFALGAASPGLPAARLESARAAFLRADAVLGPSDDGGLYLIGLKRCPRGLLADLPWGTSDAFAAAYERLRSKGLTPVVLDRWFAIDRPDVIERVRGLLRAGVIEAPATRQLLAPRISAIVQTDGASDEQLSETLASIDRVAAVDEVTVVTDATGVTPAAARTHGDVIWLVRAGTVVPCDADRYIVDALVDPEVVAGAFATERASSEDGGWRERLQAAGRLADLRSMLTGLPHAGQALFVRRLAFERVGGVPAELLGDLELARRLRQLGRVARVPARVCVLSMPGRVDEERPALSQAVLASLLG
jgi:uncharacterized protein